jgi:alanine racemase
VTDIPDVRAGDEVVIVGAQGSACISAHEAVSMYRMAMIELLARMTLNTVRVYSGAA